MQFATIKQEVGQETWESWPIEARVAIEKLERERLTICDVCESLYDSPVSFLKHMTDWTAKIRKANIESELQHE